MSNSPRYWNGERWVGGAAAQLHVINTVNGGWEEHHMKFAEKVKGVIEEMNKESEKPKLKKIK